MHADSIGAIRLGGGCQITPSHVGKSLSMGSSSGDRFTRSGTWQKERKNLSKQLQNGAGNGQACSTGLPDELRKRRFRAWIHTENLGAPKKQLSTTATRSVERETNLVDLPSCPSRGHDLWSEGDGDCDTFMWSHCEGQPAIEHLSTV